jgi:hypothetical protein
MNTAVELGAGDVTGTAGESEGIAGQTRHIPGSAGRLHPSPPLLRQHSSPAPIGNQREA